MRPWYSTSWCPQPRLDIDFGGKTEAFYFAYGDDDVVLIIDAEPAGAVALSLAVNQSGAVELKTTPLLVPAEMDQARARFAATQTARA